jgi:hypothetical protein
MTIPDDVYNVISQSLHTTTTLLRPPQDFGWDVIHNKIAFLDVVTDMVEAI